MQGTDALKALHTALVDALSGYNKAVEKAPDPQQLDIFNAMRTFHEKARGRVAAALTARGEKPEPDGSLMATINKAVVTVRSAITGLDENSLKAFASGEENVLKKYDQAIAETGADPITGELQQDRDELAAKVAKMKELAA